MQDSFASSAVLRGRGRSCDQYFYVLGSVPLLARQQADCARSLVPPIHQCIREPSDPVSCESVLSTAVTTAGLFLFLLRMHIVLMPTSDNSIFLLIRPCVKVLTGKTLTLLKIVVLIWMSSANFEPLSQSST